MILFSLVDIGVAIFFRKGSTLLIVANGLRLLGFREQPGAVSGGSAQR